jgi:septal ring-binding cell division protein DamX
VTARTTAATPASGAVKDRVDAMAREYASGATGNFTVQIQILCDASNVEKLIRGGGDVWFVPQTIGSRPCYRVFWGRYNTRDQAQQAIAQIPASIRDRNAAVKPVPKG